MEELTVLTMTVLHVQLLKRVNGHEISWALGAMFDMLSSDVVDS